MDRNYRNQLVVLVNLSLKPMKNRSIRSRQCNQGRLLTGISHTSDEGDIYGPNELTGWTGCDADSRWRQSEMDTVFPSSQHSELVGRPVTTDGQVSLGDTPPSSDSGIHSLEEQWENMSISAVDLESEQNERPTSGSPMGRRGSDTRVPPNTEKEEDINCPWMNCLLEGESDELSSIDRPNYRKDIQYHCASSVTDGGNSDTGVLSDFSDYEEDTQYTPEMLDEIRRINEIMLTDRSWGW